MAMSKHMLLNCVIEEKKVMRNKVYKVPVFPTFLLLIMCNKCVHKKRQKGNFFYELPVVYHKPL